MYNVKSTSKTDVIERRWSEVEPVRNAKGFYTSPLLRPYIIENAYGPEYVEDYREDPFYAEDLFIDLHLRNRRVETALSLCCGYGAVERYLVGQLPSIRECLGLDLAAQALDVARQRAAEEGLSALSYERANLNDYDWPDESYDLVIANGALHHLVNLEGAFEGIYRALKPGGIFYGCEYVGPSYQQPGKRQLELINAAAFLLPPELRVARRPVAGMGMLKRLAVKVIAMPDPARHPEWPLLKRNLAGLTRLLSGRTGDTADFRPLFLGSRKVLLKSDPSEGVRAADILPLARKRFPDITVRPMGGGILMFALDQPFFDCYAPTDPRHAAALAMLCSIERELMRQGEIGIDNAFLIAEKE